MVERLSHSLIHLLLLMQSRFMRNGLQTQTLLLMTQRVEAQLLQARSQLVARLHLHQHHLHELDTHLQDGQLPTVEL
jgi:hypothetical protein